MVKTRTGSLKHLAGASAVMALVLAPVAVSAATESDTNTVQAVVGSTISVSSGAAVSVNITPDANGQASSASDTVTVSTNNSAGFSLTLSNSDTTTSLENGGDVIAAHTGTYAAPSTLANNSWGYRVDNLGTFGAGPTTVQTNVDALAGTWAGVPSSASPQAIKSVGNEVANDTTTVWYGIKADTTKPSGTYSDTVTYTATTL